MPHISKLGIGPMSPEIVEGVFFHAQNSGVPLMLIASKNQIDFDGGYCGNWNTKQYAEYLRKMKQQYPKAQVFICRDHCGPGFKNNDLADVYKTIDADIENHFDLIHVDFCHFKGARKELLEESKKAILYIKNKNPKVLLEVGTDENVGVFLEDVSAIEKDMTYFSNIAPLEFFVVQTGSLVKEQNQVGGFNREFILKIKEISQKYKLGLKEHNCDYVEAGEIQQRQGIIDAVNVAPQFGVLQTTLTLQKCITYGIDFTEFLNDAYLSGKWKKWMYKNSESNKYLCSVLAGHYIFSHFSYQRLVEKINKYEDFKLAIIQELSKNFNIYLKNL
jgi:hypothetical protein